MVVTTSTLDPATALEYPQRFIVATIPQCEGRPGEPLYETMMVAAPSDVSKGVVAVYDFNEAPAIVFDAWIFDQVKEHEVDVSALLADIDRKEWRAQNRWHIARALRDQSIDLPVYAQHHIAVLVAEEMNKEATSNATKP